MDREFGTGALKITPGHDPNDYEIGRRVGLATLNIMNDDGTLNTSAGAYAGLDRFDARKRIWADLQACSHAVLCLLLLIPLRLRSYNKFRGAPHCVPHAKLKSRISVVQRKCRLPA